MDGVEVHFSVAPYAEMMRNQLPHLDMVEQLGDKIQELELSQGYVTTECPWFNKRVEKAFNKKMGESLKAVIKDRTALESLSLVSMTIPSSNMSGAYMNESIQTLYLNSSWYDNNTHLMLSSHCAALKNFIQDGCMEINFTDFYSSVIDMSNTSFENFYWGDGLSHEETDGCPLLYVNVSSETGVKYFVMDGGRQPKESTEDEYNVACESSDVRNQTLHLKCKNINHFTRAFYYGHHPHWKKVITIYTLNC